MPKGFTKLNFLTNLLTKSIPHGKWWRFAKSVIRLMKQYPSSHSIVCQYGRILVHPILGQSQWILIFFSDISSLSDNPKLPEHGHGPSLFEHNDIIITDQDVIDQLQILNVTKPQEPQWYCPNSESYFFFYI